jgi:hypothetical protein
MFLGKSIKSEMKEDTGRKPLKAINAYLLYQNDIVPKLKSEEGLSHRDAMGKAGKLWQELSDKEKASYNKIHEEDVQR